MNMQLLIGDSGLITSGATIATLVYATLSFLHAHERQKKQSTIEFYDKISAGAGSSLRQAISELLDEYPIELSYKTISPNDPKWIRDHNLQTKLLRYCRYMERLAVGIKIKVYDEKTFYSIAGLPTILLYRQIEKLLDTVDPSNKDDKFSSEYRILCEKLSIRYYSKKLKEK